MINLDTYIKKVEACTTFIQDKIGDFRPTVGIILGTGLGKLASEIDALYSIEYDDLPHFPVSTVESHHGKMILGRLGDANVIALQGRFHAYEGYSAHEITFSVRVLASLGIKTLLVSNAAGGININYRRGDLMILTDHINLQGINPLTGLNNPDWGDRFPDMSEPYDPELRAQAAKFALENGIKLQEGVYLSVEGPNLETKAEYRMIKTLGGDAVGMSTTPEVIVARHMGLKVMAISVITDECFPDALQPVNIAEILEAAGRAEPFLTAIMKAVAEQNG